MPTEGLCQVAVVLQACLNTLLANPQLKTKEEQLHDLAQCITGWVCGC